MKQILVTCEVFFELPTVPGYEFVFENSESFNEDAISIWIVNPAPGDMLREVAISRFPNLKVIASPSTGTTHIDKESIGLLDRDIKIVCLRDVDRGVLQSITASSEFTYLLFLALIRNFTKVLNHDLSTWRNDLTKFRGRQVGSLNYFVFGVGRIGSNLVRYLRSMGAKHIWYYDPHVDNFEGATKIDSTDIKRVLADADAAFVCFHASKENDQFISRELLDVMKDDAYFINTSRGENVDEAALTEFINNGKFSGVAVDVVSGEQSLEVESNDLINAIHQHHNGIVSPHIAGSSTDSEKIAFDAVLNKTVELINAT